VSSCFKQPSPYQELTPGHAAAPHDLSTAADQYCCCANDALRCRSLSLRRHAAAPCQLTQSLPTRWLSFMPGSLRTTSNRLRAWAFNATQCLSLAGLEH